jgi:hypothetical protein
MGPTPDDPWRVSWGALDARAWAYLNRHGQVPASAQQGGPSTATPGSASGKTPVPRERLAGFLREACAFRVAVAWPGARESVSSGGGSVGFEFFSRDQPPARLRLEWSFETPAAWRPVVEWYGRLRQFLEGCLPETGRHAGPGLAPDPRRHQDTGEA